MPVSSEMRYDFYNYTSFLHIVKDYSRFYEFLFIFIPTSLSGRHCRSPTAFPALSGTALPHTPQPTRIILLGKEIGKRGFCHFSFVFSLFPYGEYGGFFSLSCRFTSYSASHCFAALQATQSSSISYTAFPSIISLCFNTLPPFCFCPCRVLFYFMSGTGRLPPASV